MPRLEFIAPGYKGRSDQLDYSRMVNLYLDVAGPGAKSPTALIGTPGLSTFVYLGSDVIRGMHVFNGLIYFIAADKLYAVHSLGGVSAALGTLNTSSGRVVMANNGLAPTGGDELAITDGGDIYIWNVVTSSFVTIAPSIDAHTICFLGGYFIADIGGGRWRTSDLYDGLTWNALNISTADAAPDDLLSVFNNHGELWLFGQYTTEVWYHSGIGSPPFGRISGGVLDYGIAARYSIAKGNNTIFWLATEKNNDSGEFVGIAMARGYAIEIISPPPINTQIDKYSDYSDAFGYCYNDQGHEFYVLTFPTGDATWVYDITTGSWHERSSSTGNMYVTQRHINNNYVYYNGKHYIGDYQEGRIYEMSSNLYTDSGTQIDSFRTFPYVNDKNDLRRMTIDKLQIDAEVGIGNTTKICITPNGDESAISADSGATWTAGTMPVSGGWYTVAWNGNVFCAIRSGGSDDAATSADGITWTLRTLPSASQWRGIAWNGSVFCVKGSTTKAATSPDGITWTARTTPSTTGLAEMVWNGSVFCIVLALEPSTVLTSPDGITYTSRTITTATTGWRSIAWNGSLFCAISVDGSTDEFFSTSPDGITWTSRSVSAPSVGGWWDIASNGDIFCVVTSNGTDVLTSSDGITWTARTLPTSRAWRTISWNGSVFCIAGDSHGYAAISSDGITWTEYAMPASASYQGSADYIGETTSPTVALSWSDDGGNTWTSDKSLSMGDLGEYTKRLIWRRLGHTRARIFRLGISSEIKRVFNSAHIEAKTGSS